MILVDTNVFVRAALQRDPDNKSSKRGLRHILSSNEEIVIAPQVLYEFWVVVTRPTAQNGLGWPPARASRWLQRINRFARLIPDDLRVYQHWDHLVSTQNIVGKPAHDTRLAAWMHVHRVATILTFNASHFTRYGLIVIDPRTLPETPVHG